MLFAKKTKATRQIDGREFDFSKKTSAIGLIINDFTMANWLSVFPNVHLSKDKGFQACFHLFEPSD